MTAGQATISTETLSQITNGAISTFSEVKGLSLINAGGTQNNDAYPIIVDNSNYVRAFPNLTQANAYATISIWF